MALETLKGIKQIGGVGVVHSPEEDNIQPMQSEFIKVDHDKNTIQFKIQDGPIKENGLNGCQVDTLVHSAITIIKGLNENYPSVYNNNALDFFMRGLIQLNARTTDRESRNVEGESKL